MLSFRLLKMLLLSSPLVLLCDRVLSFFFRPLSLSKDLGVIPLTQTAIARPLPYLSFTQTKGFSTPNSPHLIPRPRLSGLTVSHSNQALLPSMEKRGREREVTSKRRQEAGRGSRGMWGREAGEAAVWEAASPRGRRPAH